MNKSLEHAFPYCKFYLSEQGTQSDKLFLGTASYFATGEGMHQAFFVFYFDADLNNKEDIYQKIHEHIVDSLGKHSYFSQYPDVIMNYSEFCLPSSEESSDEVTRIKYYMPKITESLLNNVARTGAGAFSHIQTTYVNFS